MIKIIFYYWKNSKLPKAPSSGPKRTSAGGQPDELLDDAPHLLPRPLRPLPGPAEPEGLRGGAAGVPGGAACRGGPAPVGTGARADARGEKLIGRFSNADSNNNSVLGTAHLCTFSVRK